MSVLKHTFTPIFKNSKAALISNDNLMTFCTFMFIKITQLSSIYYLNSSLVIHYAVNNDIPKPNNRVCITGDISYLSTCPQKPST